MYKRVAIDTTGSVEVIKNRAAFLCLTVSMDVLFRTVLLVQYSKKKKVSHRQKTGMNLAWSLHIVAARFGRAFII